MKEFLKTSKGITLVALIVTIIVLLILATVTIKLIVDQGILGRAKGATSKYTVAEEKELIQLAYSNYKMGIAEGSPLSADKDLLERYFLGEKKQGQEVDKVFDKNGCYVEMGDKFKDNNIIKDASTSLTVLAQGVPGNGVNRQDFLVIYNQNIWRIMCSTNEYGLAKVIVGVEFETTISSDNKNDDDLDLLERYFLGPDKQGQELDKIMTPDMMEFIGNPPIQDAATSISMMGVWGDDSGAYMVIKYKENYYKIVVSLTGSESNYVPITAKVEFETSSKKLSGSQLQVKGATVIGDENSGWTITFDKTGNVYTLTSSGKEFEGIDKTEDLALLKKYFLGEDGKGKLITDVCYYQGCAYNNYSSFANSIFKNDVNSIKNADIKISFLISEYTDRDSNDFEKNNNYIKYNDVAYRVEIKKDGQITAVETVYMPTGREGQKVKYSYDGTPENEKEWTILYDYGDGVVELLSPESMGSLRLGKDDEEAQGNTDIEKAIYSYNNAVTRINKYTSSLVTNSNKISVRSVGSNPDDPNNDNPGMYSSDKLASWNSTYNGVGKNGDENYEQDLVRIVYWGEWTTINQGSTEAYCLASRNISGYPARIEFSVSCAEGGYKENSIFRYGLWSVSEQNVNPEYTRTFKVRPVVKINY